MEQPGRHVLYLAKKIGPRTAGSDGEAAAASYVLRAMDQAGIEVDMETFSSWKSELSGLAVACALGILSYLLFQWNRPSCLVVAVLAFVAFQMETWTWAVTSRLQPRSRSSNVLGRVHPTDDPLKRVVIVANYDTCRTSPFGNRRVVRLWRLFYIVTFICMLMMAVLGFIGILANLARISRSTLNIVWYAFMPFAVLVLLFTLLIFWGEVFGPRSAGASDNAAGVSVMLAVLSGIAAKPLQQTEVWGVATARGFAGGRGMVAFMRRHSRQMRKSMIINIDHPGIGEMKVLRSEGPILGFKSSRKLRKAAFEAAKLTGVNLSGGRCRVKKSDAMVALARRRPSVTVGGLKGTSYEGWRNRRDHYESIDRKSLDSAVVLVTGMLKVIDS